MIQLKVLSRYHRAGTEENSENIGYCSPGRDFKAEFPSPPFPSRYTVQIRLLISDLYCIMLTHKYASLPLGVPRAKMQTHHSCLSAILHGGTCT